MEREVGRAEPSVSMACPSPRPLPDAVDQRDRAIALARHAGLLPALRRQSQALLDAYRTNPRVSSTFATQQRWLMAHVGLALHFASDGENPGLTNARFLECVQAHRVASRNTADAFLKEMEKYGIVVPLPRLGDRRVRPLRPGEAAIGAIDGWTRIHLFTLDSLDGGGRLSRFLSEPDGLRRLQPRIADGLLRSPEIREPRNTFSLFTWLNNGGVIMEWLIAGLGDEQRGTGRYPTPVTSIAELAGWLNLSRTHLSRKLREAEGLGSIGWQARRGQSPMWVSAGFVREMIEAQAIKLAIIDSALRQTFGPVA